MAQPYQQQQPNDATHDYQYDPTTQSPNVYYGQTVANENYGGGYQHSPYSGAQPYQYPAEGGYNQQPHQYYQQEGSSQPATALPFQVPTEQISSFVSQVGSSETVKNSAAAIKESILSRDYQVSITVWLRKSWEVYKLCWWGFSAIYLVALIIPWIPYVQYISPLVYFPIVTGIYIATCNHIKTGANVRFKDMLHGMYFIIPLTIGGILIAISISIGFFLCFVPGLFLMVTLAFAPYVYVEYYCNGVSFIESMVLSVKMSTRRFFLIAWYLIVVFLISCLSVLALGVGALVGFPVCTISFAFAVEEIFGLNMAKTRDEECIGGF